MHNITFQPMLTPTSALPTNVRKCLQTTETTVRDQLARIEEPADILAYWQGLGAFAAANVAHVEGRIAGGTTKGAGGG